MQLKQVECPDCGTEFTIRWDKSQNRFKPREHDCPDCDMTGHRSEFPEQQ